MYITTVIHSVCGFVVQTLYQCTWTQARYWMISHRPTRPTSTYCLGYTSLDYTVHMPCFVYAPQCVNNNLHIRAAFRGTCVQSRDKEQNEVSSQFEARWHTVKHPNNHISYEQSMFQLRADQGGHRLSKEGHNGIQPCS